MSTLTLDIIPAQAFLHALTGNEDPNVMFEFFHDQKKGAPGKKRGCLTKQSVQNQIQERIDGGYGIFTAVNEMPGNLRGNDKIRKYRAIYQDDDDGYTGEFFAPPNFTVTTSPGKYQRYWLLPENTLTLDDYKHIMQVMCEKYGNDPGAKDAARVLRLPGTYNLKNEPFKVEYNFHHYNSLTHEIIQQLLDTKIIDTAPIPDTDSAPIAGKDALLNSIRNISAGEQLHGSLVSLSMSLANHYKPAQVEALTSIILHASRARMDTPDRWHQRVKQIPDMVTGAFKKIADEQSRDISSFQEIKDRLLFKELHVNTPLPRPPGRLGQVFDMAYWQSERPATAAAMCATIMAVSTCMGRSIQIENTIMSNFHILLGPSSSGKNLPKYFMDSLAAEFILPKEGNQNYVANADKYFQTSAKSGPGVHQALAHSGGTLAIIKSEAGIDFNDGSNKHESTALASLMQAVSEGPRSTLKPNVSKASAGDQTLYGVVINYLQESVPDDFLPQLFASNADSNGQIGRTLLYILEPKQEELSYRDFITQLNSQREKTVHQMTCNNPAFARLLELCRYNEQNGAQADIPVPDCNILRPFIPPDIQAQLLDLRLEYNDNKENTDSPLLSTAYGRRYVQLLRLLAMCAAMDAKGSSAGQVTQEHLDWSVTFLRSQTDLLAKIEAMNSSFTDCFFSLFYIIQSESHKLCNDKASAIKRSGIYLRDNNLVVISDIQGRCIQQKHIKQYAQRFFHGNTSQALKNLFMEGETFALWNVIDKQRDPLLRAKLVKDNPGKKSINGKLLQLTFSLAEIPPDSLV